MTSEPDQAGLLKLRAEDADDLAVISACLQDALVPVRDLAFAAEDRAFLLVANRFRWEGGRDKERAAGRERVLCGVSFQEIGGVSYRGFRRIDEDRILSLLSIRRDPPAANPSPADTPGTAAALAAGVIRLDFSGGAEIRLEAGRIRCYLKDLGAPWPTAWQPRHEPDEPVR